MFDLAAQAGMFERLFPLTDFFGPALIGSLPRFLFLFRFEFIFCRAG